MSLSANNSPSLREPEPCDRQVELGPVEPVDHAGEGAVGQAVAPQAAVGVQGVPGAGTIKCRVKIL